MQTSLRILATLLLITGLNATSLSADDLGSLAGKWSLKRKLDDGQTVTQQLVFKADKVSFRMMTEGGSTLLYAEGTAKVTTTGGVKVLSLTNLKAGQSDTDIQPIEEQYSAPFRVSGNICYLASGLDKEREESPRVDVYRKE